MAPNDIIYFDSAATSYLRPPEVAEAVAAAIRGFGSPGRGTYAPAVEASMAVHEARAAVARLLGAPSPAAVSFTANATEALNVAIAALLPDGGKAVTTAASHNSVLRPLMRARDLRGCTVEVARFVLDAAQSAGALPVDMAALGVDALCFTGHKALLGPQGTGGLCAADGLEVAPLLEGGTGTHSYELRQPLAMPDALEAGTLNAHGLAGLAAGVGYLLREGVDALAARTRGLAERFDAGVRGLPGVRVYGRRDAAARGGIVALNVGDADSATVSDLLARAFGICTRPGAHCAPLMHRALGTERQGAVRFSFSPFNTEDEVDAGIEALARIAAELAR